MAHSLGTNELNELFYFLGTTLNQSSSDVLELSGVPEPRLLEEAVRRLALRHPVLATRVVQKGSRFRRVRSGNEPVAIAYHQLDSDSVSSWNQHLEALTWGEPLDLQSGPPLRVHVTQTPSRVFLQIVAPHVNSDASAGYRLSHDLLEAYAAAERNEPADTTVIDVPDRSVEALFLKRLSWWQRVWFLLQALALIVHDLVTGGTGIDRKRRPRGASAVLKQECEELDLVGLKRYARHRGLTLQTVFAVAALRARERYAQGHGAARQRTMRLSCTVSLRDRALEPVADLYDTMILPFAQSLDPALTDEQLMTRVQRQLDRFKRDGYLVELYRQKVYCVLAHLLAVIMPLGLIVQLVARLIAKSNFSVSNPGPIPFPMQRMGSLEVVDYYSFSQVFSPCEVMIITSTFRGRLRLVCVHDLGNFGREEVTSLNGYLVDYLQRLASDPPVPAAQRDVAPEPVHSMPSRGVLS